MTEDIETRRQAAGLFFKGLRSPKRRALLTKMGHKSGQPIIVALDTDTLGDVFGRLYDEKPEPPAIIAMARKTPKHFQIVLFAIEPGPPDSTADQVDAHHAATIGMLYDTMCAQGKYTYELTVHYPSAASATLRANELVDA